MPINDTRPGTKKHSTATPAPTFSHETRNQGLDEQGRVDDLTLIKASRLLHQSHFSSHRNFYQKNLKTNFKLLTTCRDLSSYFNQATPNNNDNFSSWVLCGLRAGAASTVVSISYPYTTLDQQANSTFQAAVSLSTRTAFVAHLSASAWASSAASAKRFNLYFTQHHI